MTEPAETLLFEISQEVEFLENGIKNYLKTAAQVKGMNDQVNALTKKPLCLTGIIKEFNKQGL